MTALFLYTRAGGRCEFDGCNKNLLEHYPTEASGNFGEKSHIFAFSEGGSRGLESGRPENIHDLSNLILMCPECHHLVDDVRPADYPVERLRSFKQEHEERILRLTGLSKDMDTIPVVLKGNVNGRRVDVSDEEMQAAVEPNYLKSHKKVEIDLTGIPDSPDADFWKTSSRAIDQKVQQLYSLTPRPGRTLRVSVFALAPIPLLVYLGSKLSDKMHVDLYQRHRDPETWSWKEGSGKAEYVFQKIVEGHEQDPVALLVNLSGENGPCSIPTEVGSQINVYELALEGQQATPLFLNTRGDLERFLASYLRTLATIRQAHPTLGVLHLFPAVPAPIAVTLGRVRLPKVDPAFLVYDRDARAGGFAPTMEVK